MATSNSLANMSTCIKGTHPLCALWTYLLGCVKIMARTIPPPPTVVCIMAIIGNDKPPHTHLEPPEKECSPLPTLHEGSGGRYEVASLMTPISVTPWARTPKHHEEHFKIAERWQWGGIYHSLL